MLVSPPAAPGAPGAPSAPSATSARSARRTTFWLGLLLAVLTAAVYWPSLGFEFLNYDDPEYVTDNPHVSGGLSAENAAWAFGASHAANWHPLTWLSHQLDCTLFGLEPGPPHAVNVALHVGNALLLLALLRALGLGALAAAWVAALFALHPMHIESVAWVSERKDLLSTLFALLTLRVYLTYARGLARPGQARSARVYGYLGVTLFLALGLMAKPMLVTLPVVLLLLDHWPLARVGRRALLEKLPWFALALASSLVTLVAQAGAKSGLDDLGVGVRVQTALVGYGRYLLKMFWPLDTAVLYPHPYMPGGEPYGVLQVAGAAALLLTLTLLVGATWRRGWTVLGWGWFAVMLLPVCGLVQVGSAAIADRYTYLSYVGLWILLAQIARSLEGRGAAARAGLGALGVASVLACTALTVRALPHWQDSEALFRRALAVTPSNPLARVKLGGICDSRLDFEAAEGHYRAALELWPTMPEAQLGLATTLNRSGRSELAIPAYRRALELDPQNATAHTNLGLLLSIRGQRAEGLVLLQRALELDGEDPVVLRNLGLGYQAQGDLAQAEHFLTRALELQVDVIGAQALANLSVQLGRPRRAANVLERALEVAPDNVELRWSCASAHASAGDAPKTRAHLVLLRDQPPKAYSALRAGTLLMHLGAVDDAIAEFERALRENPAFSSARQALEAARRQRDGG